MISHHVEGKGQRQLHRRAAGLLVHRNSAPLPLCACPVTLKWPRGELKLASAKHTTQSASALLRTKQLIHPPVLHRAASARPTETLYICAAQGPQNGLAPPAMEPALLKHKLGCTP